MAMSDREIATRRIGESQPPIVRAALNTILTHNPRLEMTEFALACGAGGRLQRFLPTSSISMIAVFKW